MTLVLIAQLAAGALAIPAAFQTVRRKEGIKQKKPLPDETVPFKQLSLKSHTTFLLTFNRSEFSLMIPLSCKGDWEMLSLFWTMMRLL